MQDASGSPGGKTVQYVGAAWVLAVVVLVASVSHLPSSATRHRTPVPDHYDLGINHINDARPESPSRVGPSSGDQTGDSIELQVVGGGGGRFSEVLEGVDHPDGTARSQQRHESDLKTRRGVSSVVTTTPIASLDTTIEGAGSTPSGPSNAGMRPEPTLVIAIGVAPMYFNRRAALRSTWLSWCIEAPDCTHIFFTEHPSNTSRGYTSDASAKLNAEAAEHGDMIFQEGASGYGKENGRRELFHIQWALANIPGFKYYLRVDDDGFLCLRQLLEELRYHHDPERPLLHGKYHCHAAKARMDENYLLLSYQLCAVLARGFGTGFLPFAPKLTFALNLGNVVPLLTQHGLVVFDDQQRICWPYGRKAAKNPCHTAWRGELTKRPGAFCDNFIWSHWVKEPADLYMIYDLQTNVSSTDTMRPRRTDAEKRSNTPRLAKFREAAATPVCNRWPGFEGGGIPFYKQPESVVGKNWGIPGMRNLDNDSKLRKELDANVSALFASCSNRQRCWVPEPT